MILKPYAFIFAAIRAEEIVTRDFAIIIVNIIIFFLSKKKAFRNIIFLIIANALKGI